MPYFEARHVTLRFPREKPKSPAITCDGPNDSPHRYGKERLCVWHPRDERTRRWEPDDGLTHLLVLVQLHLFKEAWWRETGEWLGPEIHPTPEGPKEPE